MSGLAASLASIESVGEKGEGYGRSAQRKAGLLKSLAVRAMSEAEYVSTGTLSRHQADGAGRSLSISPCHFPFDRHRFLAGN